MEERNTQIDSLKFFLIFLVLVGHCLDIGLSSYLNNSLFRFIYSFHMPVFVLLSGMMFKEKGFRALMGGYFFNSHILSIPSSVWRKNISLHWGLCYRLLAKGLCV